jgi:excisionase family DNA binding protein
MSIANTGISRDEMRTGPAALACRVYTVPEVAQLLGLSRNRAFVAAREGRLPVPVIRIGRRMFVSRAALDRFLETGESA